MLLTAFYTKNKNLSSLFLSEAEQFFSFQLMWFFWKNLSNFLMIFSFIFDLFQHLFFFFLFFWFFYLFLSSISRTDEFIFSNIFLIRKGPSFSHEDYILETFISVLASNRVILLWWHQSKGFILKFEIPPIGFHKFCKSAAFSPRQH